MSEPVAYLNGQLVPVSEAKVSIFDLGLVLGASVTEMIRTFRHEPFHLDSHLQRLFRSLRAVGFPQRLTSAEIRDIVLDVTARNSALIPSSHDLGIVVFTTAGQNLTYLGGNNRSRASEGTVCVHTFPLPFELWAAKYENGQHLVTPSVRHIPPDSVDPRIKCRSRMHWYLADRQARLVEPDAGALVLDHGGNVTETSTGNFFLVIDGTIVTPSTRTTLGGVSQVVVQELAADLGIPFEQRDFTLYEAFNADEAFTSSTPYCILPVTKLNGQEIGNGRPGNVFGKLAAAWSELVGVDLLSQISTGAEERLASQNLNP